MTVVVCEWCGDQIDKFYAEQVEPVVLCSGDCARSWWLEYEDGE